MAPEFEESAEDLYENAPCGYMSMLRNGEIVRVNTTLCRWLGMDREELLGSRFQNLLPIGPRLFHDTHFAPMLHLQGFAKEIALELRCSDGRNLPVLVNAIDRTPPNGGPTIRRLTVFDATERLTFERDLLAAKAEATAVAEKKARFLAMLSHDIRSPLQSIRIAAEVLKRTPDSPPPPDLTEMLTRATDQVLELVDSILTLSRMEAGTDPVDKRAMSVTKMVDDLAQVEQQRADKKGLLFTTHVDPDVPSEMFGDAPKVKQVLSNLVSNALKFTDAGHVSLKATVEARSASTAHIRFLVEDTGSGIDQSVVDTIFDAYDQGANPVARQLGGSGLGLSICRSIGDLLEGELGVSSTLGSGSAFWFTVPFALEDTEA